MIFLDGLLTGLLLQIAIGPVFFYILNLTLQRSLLDGLLAVLAAVLVDYLYITLAILGVGRLLDKKIPKRILAISSSIILMIFGWLLIRPALNGLAVQELANQPAGSLISSFLTTLLLTISSPLTIIFWTSIFATKAIEKEYSERELPLFGAGAGLATMVFLGLTVTGISNLGLIIPANLIRNLNFAVGVILILFGVVRLLKMNWRI